MRPRTLSFRLIASSVVWVTASLLATGVLLTLLFRDHIERRFDDRLRNHLEDLVAATDVAPNGELQLIWTPSDPRYNRPLSGWYWQVSRNGQPVAESESAFRQPLEISGEASGVREFPGPDQRSLRGLVTKIHLPGSGEPVEFAVAGPIDDIQRDVGRFTVQIAITLGVLGAGLVTAVLVQVRFGLRPLRVLQQTLSQIRSGARQRLPATFPAEVQPVATELNALLDHNAASVERYRTQTANLAHALKNPLTVLTNEIRDIEGERGALLKEQAAAVSKHIQRHLSRARVAASRDVIGARSSLATAVADIRFSMQQLHRGKQLDIRVSDTERLFVRSDTQDLEELLGNLMDNACKWARTTVQVTAGRSGERVWVAVEDDGPGIPVEQREEVLAHGRRLDSRVPGSGLGLGIVRDVVELYGGSLALGDAALGGLRAELELPAAD